MKHAILDMIGNYGQVLDICHNETRQVGSGYHPFLLVHPLLVNIVYPDNVFSFLLCLKQFLTGKDDMYI